jgi:hypothetical protein
MLQNKFVYDLAPKVLGKNEFEGESGYAVSVRKNWAGDFCLQVFWDNGGEDYASLENLEMPVFLYRVIQTMQKEDESV